MKKALSLLMAALFLVLCLPVTALAEGKTPPGAIYGNYDKEATAYIWQFGEMAAGESPTAVSYSDAYASIRAGLAAGDSISSGGIAFTGAGCLEPNDTKGFASAAESGRYLLVRPAVSGTLEICVRFDKASNTRKCRIYYQDLGELDSVEAAADLSGLNKNGTEIGTATTSDPVTWQLSLTAGHVYGFVTYNDSPAQITALRLLTTEVPGGPGEGGEEGGSGSGEMPAPAGDAVTGVWDDSHTAYRWTFGKTTAVETSAIYDAAPSGENAPALRLGMAAGDHTDASGLHLAGYGVSDDGITAASTGRYLLVKPAQNGTIQMSLSATLSGGKPKARIYTADLGEVELAAADLTQLQKAGDPLAAVETTSGSDSGTMSLQAGHVYGFAVYAVNASDILLYDLSFTPESDQPEPEPEPEPEPKPEPEPEDPYKPSGTSQTEFTFEESDTAAWTLSSASVTADAHGGSNGLTINKNGSASITVNDLPQGSYTVSLWAKGSANGARMSVSGTGGPDSVLKLDNALSGQDGWVQAAHRNVLVYNGQMTLTFVNYTDGLSLDDIQITLDANDNNPVSNWDFESGLDGWETSGTVALTDAADTGSQAVQLADQSEVHQTISVQPDTDYIATVRMKVDVEDTFTSTEQYSLDGSTLMGLLVERTSTGNRVNLGVRGVDGTVLRQAPSATAGYSLVTIAFHTGPNQTQVELYANTIFDEAYKDSVTVHENTFGSENPYPNGWQRPNPDQVDTTHLADDWTSNGSHFAYVDNFDVFQVDNTYIKGADMSFLQVIEDCGGKYFANGVQQDALRILSNHGVNSVLGMIFVHSGNEVYTWDTLTHLGTSVTGFDGEYVTGRQQVVGYFDETHTTALALRCQELGMTFTPSFHYSDTWISAAKAHMPYEWLETDYEGNLSNPDIEMLGTAVYNYVYDFLTGMKEAGVDNVITVKNGNEQNGGLLFPVASGISQNHAAIITASSRAVRQVYPGAINTIHTNTGYDPKQLESFFGRLLGYGAEFDGMGFSLYGGRDTSVQLTMMKAALADDTLADYDYINVETGFSYSSNRSLIGFDGAMGLTQYFDISPNGQYNYLLNYIQAPMDVPNPTGVTRGFYYWNSEAIGVYGAGHKLGEAISGTQRALFNGGDASVQEMGCSQPGKSGDMTEGMYAYLHRGTAKAVSGEVYTPLSTTADTHNVAEPASLTLSQETMTLRVGEWQRLQQTIAPENALLSRYHIAYTSSDPSIARVYESGVVEGCKPGIATVTATVGGVSDTVQVTVGEPVAASGMTVTYCLLREGEEVETGTVTDGMTLNTAPYDSIRFSTSLAGEPASSEVLWTMDASESASWYGDTWQTKDGVMRTLATELSSARTVPAVQMDTRAAGTVQVKAAAANDGPELDFTVRIVETPLTALEIAGDTTVRSGRTLQLQAVLTPTDATFYKINWTSSNTAVATVDANGKVTALSPGTVQITATSDQYPAISDSITLEVTPILVEQLMLSHTTMAIQTGSSKTLSVTVTPANAHDPSVTWSVEPGGEAYISVDQNGTVTALAEGAGTITATANDGSGVTASCTVTVQSNPIPATGMELSEEEVWIRSNYFSPDTAGRGDAEPVYQLTAHFTPDLATNTDVTWTSDNEAVATVDANGVVTAHQGGIATITAVAADGGFTDSAVVHVPVISDDWENYMPDTSGGFTDGNTFTFAVVENGIEGQSLQAKVSSSTGSATSQNRRKFSAVSGDTVVVDFDWNVGHFTSDKHYRGAHISLEDANGNSWLALAAFPKRDGKQAPMAYYYKDGSTAFPSSGKNFNYIHGGLGPKATFADCKVLDGLLTGDDQIYHIRVTLDFTTRTISFTVTDAADPSKSQTVSDLAMDPSIDYADNVGALVFSHYFSSAASWTTSIDNFSVYGTSVAPASIEYTVDCVNLNAVDGIKLVPVEGALSATAKLSPTVYPTAADQTVIYTVSDELKDWITVASDGTITIKPDKNVLYDQAATVDKVSGSIRIQSAVDETIFQDVKVLVGPPNTNEKLTLTVNGTEYSETAMQFPVGQAVDLGFAATGGDGNSDLFRYKWTTAENTAGAILDGNTLTAKQEGTVTLNFVIDFFRGETTKTIELVFADKAEPPVDPDEPDSPEEGGDPSDPDQPDTPQGGGDSSGPEQPTPAEPQQPDQGDSGQTTSRPDDKKAVTAQNVSEISEPNSITQPSSIPQTADPFPLGLCLLITAASFGALILLLLLKYDRRSTQNK